MKVKILSLAHGLNDILSSRLQGIGLRAETVDYSLPLSPQIEDADILVNGLGRVDRALVDSCRRLRMVHMIGTGTDNVDVDYCTSKSIYVANVPKVNAIAVAEHTMFLMIHMAKNIKVAEKGLIQRRVLNVLGSQLHGKTLLVVGLGYIGLEVAKRASAFGMDVVAVTKNPGRHRNLQDASVADGGGRATVHGLKRIGGPGELAGLLPGADYVSIHASLTDETRNMMGRKEFAQMKKTAFLINAARAQTVDRDALYAALSTGQIAGAAFDVFWEEPANPADRLLQLNNFVLTPHIAGWTVESADMVAQVIAKNIELMARGQVPLTALNSF